MSNSNEALKGLSEYKKQFQHPSHAPMGEAARKFEQLRASFPKPRTGGDFKYTGGARWLTTV
jgi:hypothetical protein